MQNRVRLAGEANQNAFFFTLEIENRLILGFGKRLHKKIPECSLCASPGYFYYPICLPYPTGFCLLCYPLASTQSLYAWKQQHLMDQSLPNKTTIDPWHLFIKRKTIKLNPFRKTHTGPRSFMFGRCGGATTEHIHQIICKRIMSLKTTIQLKWKHNKKNKISECVAKLSLRLCSWFCSQQMEADYKLLL